MKHLLIFVGSVVIAASLMVVRAAPVQLALAEKVADAIGSSDHALAAVANGDNSIKPVTAPDKIPRLRFDDAEQTMTFALNRYRSSNVRSDEPLPRLKRSHSDPALKHLRTEFKPVEDFGINGPEDVYFAPASTKLQRTLSDFGKAEPHTLLAQARHKGLDRVPKSNHAGRFNPIVPEAKMTNIVESYWRKGRARKEWLTRSKSKDPLYRGYKRGPEHQRASREYVQELNDSPVVVAAEFLYYDRLKSSRELKPKEAAHLRALEQAYPKIAAKRKKEDDLEAPFNRLNQVRSEHHEVTRIFHSHDIEIIKASRSQREEAQKRADKRKLLLSNEGSSKKARTSDSSDTSSSDSSEGEE